MNDEVGPVQQDVYWSIEACGWVRSPARAVEIPEPREVVLSEAADVEPAATIPTGTASRA